MSVFLLCGRYLMANAKYSIFVIKINRLYLKKIKINIHCIVFFTWSFVFLFLIPHCLFYYFNFNVARCVFFLWKYDHFQKHFWILPLLSPNQVMFVLFFQEMKPSLMSVVLPPSCSYALDYEIFRVQLVKWS